MKNQLEQKIYEKLGVKIFRKFVFRFAYMMFYPFTLKLTKEERWKFFTSNKTNYNIGGHSIEDIKGFKKSLLFNSSIHVFALGLCIPGFIEVINGSATISGFIVNILCIICNIYCLMLQRYNQIKINNVLSRIQPLDNKKKDVIKEEIKKEDELLLEHTYKKINHKDKEKNVSFEEVINSLSLEDLKMMKEQLIDYREWCDILKDQVYLERPEKRIYNSNHKERLVLQLKQKNR